MVVYAGKCGKILVHKCLQNKIGCNTCCAHIDYKRVQEIIPKTWIEKLIQKFKW